jgi:hypothetical protein
MMILGDGIRQTTDAQLLGGQQRAVFRIELLQLN